MKYIVFALLSLENCCRFTMLKGTQDPSIQVNSGQVTLVFLLPGGDGETVLSEHSKITKNDQKQSFHP